MPKVRPFLVLPILVLLCVSAALGAGEEAARFHEILRNGNLEELTAECGRRGLPEQGDVLELRRRLLENQRERDAAAFDDGTGSRGQGPRQGPGTMPGTGPGAGDIVLEHADFMEYSEDERGNGLVWLRGNVQILYAGKEIRADEMSVNTGRNIITGKGDILFTDTGKEYRAESFVYDASSEEAFFYSAKTSIGAFACTGTSIRKLPDGDKFEGEGVTLSTCPLENPHYRIEGGRLSLYDGRRVLIRDASLYYGSEPVVRLPYIYRRLKERAVKSSLSFRERSGLAAQNTYYPLKTDAKQLALKGDFYERLGFYAGGDFSSLSAKTETRFGLSAALSNDVYNEADFDDFGKTVSETWTPLGPPGLGPYSINRSLRYRVYLSGSYRSGTLFDNTLALDLGWISDPYYQNDFERRSERLDLFSLLGTAEADYPRVGKGFSWSVDDTLVYRDLSVALKNRVRFEPQRNDAVSSVSLPGYYEYRVYALTAPELAVTHSTPLFEGSPSAVFSSIDYRSLGRYRHTAYFDGGGALSSELHSADTSVRFAKAYSVGRSLRVAPALELGAQGQSHVEPDSEEAADDKRQTLVYGRTTEELALGGEGLSLSLTHDLKYKILGPDDLYEFGRFRVHDLRLAGRAKGTRFEDTLTTSYDLRPRYDWGDRRYEGSLLEQDRFAPLINVITFTPFQALSASDKLVYDIAAGRMKTNGFRLNYAGKAIYLRKCELRASWDLAWEHNFLDPFLDTFSSVFGVDAKPHPLWTFSFSVLSRNDDFWKYFAATNPDPDNPLTDLLKSFNFFDRSDRENSNFKLKGVSIGFSHDLHDWVLTGGYRGSRELSYDGKRYEWNNTYSVGLSLKNVRNAQVGADFSKRR
jgi:hypothetical protein